MKPDSNKTGNDLYLEQSFVTGFIAAFLAIIILNGFWILSSVFFDRFFPWVAILQGIIIGKSIKKYGLGIEWYFPLMSFSLALFASVTGSFLCALYLTGREFGTGAIILIDEISWHTISIFLMNDYVIVGIIYGLFSGVLAAFYSQRELDRNQAIAYRKYKESLKI